MICKIDSAISLDKFSGHNVKDTLGKHLKHYLFTLSITLSDMILFNHDTFFFQQAAYSSVYYCPLKYNQQKKRQKIWEGQWGNKTAGKQKKTQQIGNLSIAQGVDFIVLDRRWLSMQIENHQPSCQLNSLLSKLFFCACRESIQQITATPTSNLNTFQLQVLNTVQ